jgi:hypothetical protein
LYKWLTGYQRMVLKALNENVRYVEIEPGPGAPPVRITSPHDIARLRGILMAATRRPAATSGPSAGANCAAKIVYGDGAVEAFQIGRIDSPRGPAMPAADGQVEVHWGGYTRYADGDGLMRLLMTPGPRETPTRARAG